MRARTNRFTIAGFNILRHEDSPTVPVMIEEPKLASEFADEILRYGIYVIGFSFLVFPQGMARIRVQPNYDMDKSTHRVAFGH